MRILLIATAAALAALVLPASARAQSAGAPPAGATSPGVQTPTGGPLETPPPSATGTPELTGVGRLTLSRVFVRAGRERAGFVPTDWMFATLAFRGRGFIGYLNLSVGQAWVIQNVPVTAMLDGAPEARWMAFSPGKLPDDTRVPLKFGYTVDHSVRVAAPPQTEEAIPAHQQVDTCGMGGGPGGRGGNDKARGGGPVPLVGGELAETPHVHEGTFPNQPAKENQCVTVAFSNSLQWIRSSQGLDTAPVDLTPGYLDHALGRAEGKAIDVRKAIAKKKKEYGKLVDTSDSWDDPGLTVDRLGALIDAKCDVEMFIDSDDKHSVGHMVALVGIARTKDGKWSIDAAHDIKQGPTNNDYTPTDADHTHQTVTETYVYSPGDNTLRGVPDTLKDRKVGAFVVECKKNKRK